MIINCFVNLNTWTTKTCSQEKALGLNEHHTTQVVGYMRFSRFKRKEVVKSINTCFDDVKTSHVMQESTFTQDEGRFAVNSEVSVSFFVIFLGIKFNFCEKKVNLHSPTIKIQMAKK